VDFTRLGAVELLGFPQAELVNRCLPADEHLPQSWVRELVERVNDAADVPTALSAINDLLLRVATEPTLRPDTTLVGKALTRAAPFLETDNADSVPHISNSLGVLPRHVNREYHRHFGMGPRRYSLIKRIHTAMTLIAEERHTDLSDLALELGFYDHAHFSSQFADSLRHRECSV